MPGQSLFPRLAGQHKLETTVKEDEEISDLGGKGLRGGMGGCKGSEGLKMCTALPGSPSFFVLFISSLFFPWALAS